MDPHPNPGQVCGLCNRPEYNGRRGRVLQYDEAAGRYAVRLEQEEGEEPEVGAVLLLRTDNMRRLDGEEQGEDAEEDEEDGEEDGEEEEEDEERDEEGDEEGDEDEEVTMQDDGQRRKRRAA